MEDKKQRDLKEELSSLITDGREGKAIDKIIGYTNQNYTSNEVLERDYIKKEDFNKFCRDNGIMPPEDLAKIAEAWRFIYETMKDIENNNEAETK